MSPAYFITGTDTGVGKTFVSCALLRTFARKGLRAVGMKPVAAGCRLEQGALLSEDVEQLLTAGNVAATPQEISPYAFEPPLAPHIAARMAGKSIGLEPILQSYAALRQRADAVVVEGVGGFRVPLNDNLDTADLAKALQLPVILVVGMRLGCLNHALLTRDAIAQAGLTISGWVANEIEPDMPAFAENVEALAQRLPAPLLSVVRYGGTMDSEAIGFL